MTMHRSNLRTLDLHGLTWAEAEASFIEFYNQTLHRGGKDSTGLDVVHGYGSTGTGGVLRTRLRGFLGRYGSCLDFQNGEKVDGNPGHTVVVPLKPLPSLRDQLSQRIWDFCDRPRSQSKIIGKFRRHGETAVLNTIKTLEKQKRLRTLNQGSHKLYQAA
ncbi:Smr/MutS family protein [SAR202 cluster bacterium AD-802-F09_MRT_200m]|nr:Smr/MutS family protein [SAR202 cluster bacterium AD-802-F09_MRT_200m]|tara:strand:- start:45 stop:524 length:480 start_codon:yes stop_codon:yes gene_type:complete